MGVNLEGNHKLVFLLTIPIAIEVCSWMDVIPRALESVSEPRSGHIWRLIESVTYDYD